MVRLIWTEVALENINEIYAYISKDSKFYAKIVVQKIREK
jgi:plasmid stabilization system protein ParE